MQTVEEFYKVQFLFEKRKHFEFVLILKKIKLNANVNVNFDVTFKKLDEKFKSVKNPTRIQIEKAGDFRSRWRTMFIHDWSGRKRGGFLSPFLSKEGRFSPLFCLMYDNNANFEKYNFVNNVLKKRSLSFYVV